MTTLIINNYDIHSNVKCAIFRLLFLPWYQ